MFRFRPEHVGVFSKQSFVDDPPLVLGLLEVRVGEQEEHLGQLPLSINIVSNSEVIDVSLN